MTMNATARRRVRPTALDLFAGAGGLSAGLRLAGFDVIAAIEADRVAAEAYRLNHPNVTLIEKDIKRVSGAALRRVLDLPIGELDLLAACPPCQGFSTMRTRNGHKRNRDSRNDLIGQVRRLARALMPRTIMLENVPGLFTDRRFTAFRAELESLGYHVTDGVLDTAHFGVPQHRRRTVLLAALAAKPQFARPARNVRSVRQALTGLPAPNRSTDRLHNYRVRHAPNVRDRIKHIPKDGGSRLELPAEYQLQCHQKTDGFRDVYGRMSWDCPSPTITGGCINPSKGRFLHPSQDRAITLREAALLQTFPRSYRFPIASGRYRVALLIGNALPPEFIRRHARQLLRLLA